MKYAYLFFFHSVALQLCVYVYLICFSFKKIINKYRFYFVLSLHPTGDAGVYFREIGGLMFVQNLAKSSEHSMVKEAALYTLGTVAEQDGKI